MAYNKAEKSDSPVRKKGGIRRKRKVCVFCGKDNVIDYKDTNKPQEICVRERQDPSPPYHRQLREAPEGADFRHQEGAPRGIDALRSGLRFKVIKKENRKHCKMAAGLLFCGVSFLYG